MRRFLSQNLPLLRAYAVAIAARLGLAAVAFVAYYRYPILAPDPSPQYHLPELSVLGNRLLSVWANWDGTWYLKIADQGYQADPRSLAFFPLYPELTRVLALGLGRNYLVAGLAISTLMCAAAVFTFFRLVRLDFQEATAERAVVYAFLFPTAFFYFASYTEALFLALTLLAFYWARHGRWWLAAIVCALAALTRSMGVLVVIPLGIEWVIARRATVTQPPSPGETRRAGLFRMLWHPSTLSFLLPVAALVGWLLYAQATYGSAITPLSAVGFWTRSFNWPWLTVLDGIRVIFVPGPYGLPVLGTRAFHVSNVADLLFFIFCWTMFVSGFLMVRRGQLRLSYWVYAGIGLIFPLLNPTQYSPLDSYPRYVLVLFPLFIVLARLAQQKPWRHYLYLGVSVPLLGLLFARFANWFWVA